MPPAAHDHRALLSFTAHIPSHPTLHRCRRLHTIIERLMEELSFTASERAGERIVLSEDDVQKAVSVKREV